ncbi:MAG TPA: glycoside hydrolase family 15 protein [Candidatus Aquilonibacter sp.]|nr:glycoside hydrolase family 15 protein [Candidatus Aquilonibacter sp.]
MKRTSHAKSVQSAAMPAAIGDYALIGDCETAALVSREGSIDWLCLPRFDSPACFAALIGTPENGRWQLKPKAKARAIRRYRPHTLVLDTEFQTSEGKVTLTDFMPLGGAHRRLIRIIHGRSGKVRMTMDLAIRFDYGLTIPWVTRNGADLSAIAGPHRLILRTPVAVRGKDFHTISEFTVKAGETIHFELLYADSFRAARPRSGRIEASLKKTEKFWSRWAARCKYKGRWSDAVERSLITLKALTYAPTGGIVAAPTTSLPEKPGGALNWDYRFCWLRDATFTLLALIHAGYHEEARRWQAWLVRAAAGSADQLQIMYGVAGERLLREWEVPWLPGYRNSSPVRVGNEASEQLQLDVYGELADVLHQARTSAKIGVGDFDLQFALLEHLQKIWRLPDHGIWEVRGKKRHFTHSKVMAWVAFDRTIRGAERFGIKAPLDQWRSVRQEIHDQICRLGFDSGIGSFVQSYGSKKLDASLLLLPLVGFLPPTDERILGTVRAIEKELIHGGFVMRYRRTGKSRRPIEGAFLPCGFWLADYYELAGRHRDAERLVSRLLKVRNDVGLISEEYQVEGKQLVGNFPQALSHVALVNAIINLHTKHGPARQRSNSRAHYRVFP